MSILRSIFIVLRALENLALRQQVVVLKRGVRQLRLTHIELVLSPGDSAKIRRVIVEVTPRWRAAMHAHGVNWSTKGEDPPPQARGGGTTR